MFKKKTFSPTECFPEDITAPLLEVRNLAHVYGEGTPFRHVALDGVSFSIKKGELVGLIGHTGSGKSTLASHLNGLLKPVSGSVYLHGKDIYASKETTVAARYHVGLVMQYPEYQLFEETVEKDIAFGPRNKGLEGTALKEAVEKACDQVFLPRRYLSLSPFELSGGEKRRVAIAGILAMDPELLVMDEPAAGLDPRGQNEIFSLITSLRRDYGKTVLFVSHSMDLVAEVCDRILVMNQSRLVMDGTPEEIFRRADELRTMGLDLPEITVFFDILKAGGLACDTPVYKLSQAVDLLSRMKKRP